MATYEIRLIVTGEDRASGPLHNVGGSLMRMGEIAGGILTADIFRRIANGIQNIANSAFQAVGEMQSLRMSLESIAATELVNLGKAQNFTDALEDAKVQGQDLLKWLRKLSVVSPFEYTTVADAFQFNASMGQSIDTAKKTTKAILDFAAGVGLSQAEMQRFSYAMAQTGATGKITAMDLRQFANSRFGLKQLAGVFEILSEKTGVAIKDHNAFNLAMATGRVTTEQFFDAFAEFVEKGYGGAAGRMIKTLPGLISNVHDVLFFAMNDLFGGLGEEVVGALSPVVDAVSDILEAGGFQAFGEKIRSFLAPAIQEMGRFLKILVESGPASAEMREFISRFIPPEALSLIENFSDVLSEIGQMVSGVVNPAFRVLSENALPLLGQVLTFVNDNWESFRGALLGVAAVLSGGALASILAGIASAIAALNWPLLLLVGAVGLLSAAWASNWGNIQGITAGIVAWLQANLIPLFNTLSSWFQDILPVAMAVFQTALIVLQDIISAAVTVLQPTIESFLANIGSALAAFGPTWEAFKNLWLSLEPLLGMVAAAAGAILLLLFGVFVGVINGIITMLAPLLETIANTVTSVINILGGLIDFLVNLFSFIYGIVTNNTALVEQSFSGMRDAIVKIVSNLVNGVVNLFSGLWESVKGLVEGFVSGAIGFFQNLYNELIGHSIIPDMINGIISAFSGFVGSALDIFGQVVSGIKKIFGIDWASVGEEIVTGIMNAVTGTFANIPALLEGITQAFSSLFSALGTVVAQGVQALFGPLQALVNMMTGLLMPVFAVLTPVIAEILPAALTMIAMILSDMILVALIGIAEYMAGVLLPFLMLFADYLVGVFFPVLLMLNQLLVEVLLVALEKVGDYITRGLMVFVGMMITQWLSQLIPAIILVAGYFRGTFTDAVSTASEAVQSLIVMCQGAIQTIYGLISAIQDLADAMATLQLPDDFTPGSPTPAEIGFRGISSALRELSSIELPKLQSQISLLPAMNLRDYQDNLIGGTAGNTYDNRRTITVNVEGGGPNLDEEKLAEAVARWEFFYAGS